MLGSHGQACDVVCSGAGLSCNDGDWGVDNTESLRAALGAAGLDADELCPTGFWGWQMDSSAPTIYANGYCDWQMGPSTSCSANPQSGGSGGSRLCRCTTPPVQMSTCPDGSPCPDCGEESCACAVDGNAAAIDAESTRATEAEAEPPPGFVGPFEGMGITEFNDLGSALASSPSECASRCASLTGCNSFDWGARGEVRGECWLSSADRDSAGDAYTSWPLYDYYEKQQ